MLLITAQNNGNGTVTVSVSGSESGAINTIRYLRVGSQYWHTTAHLGRSDAWQSGGTRTGDGDVTFTTGTGACWFYCESETAVSGVAYQCVDSGDLDVLDQIMESVRSRILLMELSGISAANVTTHAVIDQHIIKGIDDGDRIVIGPGGPESLTSTGPLQSDDIDYPIVVAHLSAANKSQEGRIRWFMIRQRIRQAFLNQPLPTASGTVWRCQHRPLDPISRDWWDQNAMVSPQQLVFTSRETRGI